MKKRSMLKVTALLLTAIMITGCAGKSGSDSSGNPSQDSQQEGEAAGGSSAGGVTLNVACNRDCEGLFKEIEARFNEQYPDISIELYPFEDYTALNTNVLAAHQSGDDYDLVTVNHVDTLSFIKGGILYDMTDYIEENKIDVDSIIMGNLEDMGKFGGRQYTIPSNTDTRIIMVNKDLFAKYNLEVPTTLDEMLSAGKTISEAGQGDYVFTDEMCTHGDYFSTYEAGIFLQSFGGQLYTVGDDGKAVATIDTPEMKAYLTFIHDLLPYMPEDCTTNNDARSAFCEGNIGMYTFGPWEYLSMDIDSLDFEWELMKVPAGPAGSVSTSGGFQMGIGAGSTHIDEAMKFLDFMINDAQSMALIGESGLPTVEAAYEQGTFASEKYDVFKEQLKTSNLPQVPVANLGEVVACFTGYWNEMCTGKITVDEMIEKSQPEVQKLLDEND